MQQSQCFNFLLANGVQIYLQHLKDIKIK